MFSNKKEFKGAVIGMLLGDGCIPKIQRGTNAYFRIGHSVAQKEYAEYKKGLLEWLTACRQYIQKRYDGKGTDYITIDSRVHPFYTALRNHMYIDGRKTIDEHVMKCLTPLGLALWYQDDGCLTNHESFLTPFLCTHGFSKAEVEMMSRMLQKSFGLQWRLRKDKSYYALRLRRRDKEEFFNLIRPYIHEIMKYKIRDDGRSTVYKGPVNIICGSCKSTFKVLNKDRHRKYCSCLCYHNSRREKRIEPQLLAEETVSSA